MLIYGIKKLKLVGLRLERFDPEYSPLIPDPLVSVPNFSRMVAILVHHRVPILDNGGTGLMDLGSVIIDCGDKHYNKGSMRLDIQYR